MSPKIAQIALFIGAIVLPTLSLPLPLPGLPDLGGSSSCPASETLVTCGLLDVSLKCEKQCDDTQVCVNVCTNLLKTVGNLLSILPVKIPAISTCMCQEGFYRDRAGSCVGLDLCAHGGVNLKKRAALPLPLPLPELPIPELPIPSLPGLGGSGSALCQASETLVTCGLLDVSLKCEKQCDDTQVCVNVCTNLLNTVGNLLSILPVKIPALTTCMCQEGTYRNRAGACVGLDLCASTGVNLKKRAALPLPLPLPELPIPELPIPSLPGLPGLGGSSSCPASETPVTCGLLDVNLKCEKQCDDTQVCVNVCTGLLNTVGNLLSNLPVNIPAITTCMCQEGTYRNRAGSCVGLDLCAHGGINL